MTMFVDNDWQNGWLSSPDGGKYPFVLVPKRREEQKILSPAGKWIAEKALTIRSKKQKRLSES